MCPSEDSNQLGHRPVSESSLCAQWVAKDPNFLQTDSEDSDQTGRMPRLICLRWAHMPFCWFRHDAAQMIVKTMPLNRVVFISLSCTNRPVFGACFMLCRQKVYCHFRNLYKIGLKFEQFSILFHWWTMVSKPTKNHSCKVGLAGIFIYFHVKLYYWVR